ncbi:hypothetical protein [Agrobacterium vitis]|uniref:Uncharacterized protein n=1 Tax=Agrobacterium vitis TaxID=373 RepID=A0AAE2UT76_AGRVI|nr:hypothetical protein [Agrobacterium vitis]MBF2716898.1 hypothetical protein [Agrobacterium vitis]
MTKATKSHFSPDLQAIIDANRKRYHDASGKEEDNIHQLAVLIKAAEVATQAMPDDPHHFLFAAGYIGALITGKKGLERANAIAATL